MKSVLIVGAGPSAYITALTCIELNLKITIVNPDINNWDNTQNSNLNQKSILKRRYTNRTLYSLPAKISKVIASRVDIFENFTFGGLSEIWGGVFFPPAMSEIDFDLHTTAKFNNALDFIEKRLKIDTNNEVYKSIRNPFFPPKMIEGKPIIAYSNLDSIQNWSAADMFKNEEFHNVEFIDGYVQAIKQTSNENVETEIINKNNEKIYLGFNKVFLAAGVFGTARILLENAPGIKTLEIRDSAVSFGLGIDFSKKAVNSIDKVMRPDRVLVYFEDKGKARYFVQIYRISIEMIESLKYRRFHKILIYIFNSIGIRLRLVMIFQSAIQSKSIVMKKQINKITANSAEPKELKKFQVFSKLKIFMNTKLLPLSYFMTGKPGAGVHSGAYIPVNKPKHDGVIPADWATWPDVHVVGAASLPSVPTGPIMLAGMANSRVIALNVFMEDE
jgi:hypothetical protein